MIAGVDPVQFGRLNLPLPMLVAVAAILPALMLRGIVDLFAPQARAAVPSVYGMALHVVALGVATLGAHVTHGKDCFDFTAPSSTNSKETCDVEVRQSH
jgi:hypothetical protein